jgi:hypothetical protein
MNAYAPTLNVGDILTRPKLQGLIEHCGVVIGHDAVLHNTPERGEHLTSVREFSASQPMQVRPTGINPQIVSARSYKILANPKRYDAVNRNCQHTVSEVVCGIAKSPLVLAAILIAIIATIIIGVNLIRNR